MSKKKFSFVGNNVTKWGGKKKNPGETATRVLSFSPKATFAFHCLPVLEQPFKTQPFAPLLMR